MLLPSTVVAPSGPVAVGIFVARGVALTALAVGLGWWLLNLQQAIQSVRLIAERLAPFPESGTLAAGLADALADPGLRLVYALPGDGGYVEADGHVARVGVAELSGERATEIRNGNDLVAIAIHSATAAREPISPELGADVQLAADNERLLASVRHQLLELQASRARVVETGDATRRTLERNLHDGAQQRMLLVVRDLSMARDAAAEARHPGAATLARAVDEADATTAALRSLARGIHPAHLDESGLSASLEALADEAPLPLIIDDVPDARFDPSAELAAWRIVAQSVSLASRSGGDHVRVAVTANEQHLTVTVEVEGLDEPLDTLGLEDLAGAAGGELSYGATTTSTRLEARLPCG